MYSRQGLVTTKRRSAAGSSLKYAAELNIVAVVRADDEADVIVAGFRGSGAWMS